MLDSHSWDKDSQEWRWLRNLSGSITEQQEAICAAFRDYCGVGIMIGTAFDPFLCRPTSLEDNLGFGIYVQDVEAECEILREDILNLECGHKLIE